MMGFLDINKGRRSWGPWTERLVKGPYSDEEGPSLNGVGGRNSNSVCVLGKSGYLCGSPFSFLKLKDRKINKQRGWAEQPLN